MKLLFTLPFLLLSGICFAQNVHAGFYKFNGKQVDIRDSADYVRVISAPDSGSKLFNVAEVYINGKKKLIGKSSAFNQPKYEGQCVTFYQNGKRQSISNYKDGGLVDQYYEFYTNGKPYIILQYPSEKRPGDYFFIGYLIKANYDSLGVAWVTDGNGTFKRFDNKFKQIIESGTVKDGKMDGEWTGTDHDGKWHYAEKYNNGVLVTGTVTDENGVSTNYTKTRGTEPMYKGGLNAFYGYLGRTIKYPPEDRKNNVQGRVMLSFVVEKDGKITNIKVDRSVSYGIDLEAVNALEHAPRWIPGTMYGRPVRVQYAIPIAFALQDE